MTIIGHLGITFVCGSSKFSLGKTSSITENNMANKIEANPTYLKKRENIKILKKWNTPENITEKHGLDKIICRRKTKFLFKELQFKNSLKI